MADIVDQEAEKTRDVGQSVLNGSACKKREGYLEWPDYFMAIAFLSAQRSKDPRTQVGACIVNEENKIVGIGYNGMPVGCSDDVMPWARSASDILDTKQLYELMVQRYEECILRNHRNNRFKQSLTTVG